jgi:hypothetical protein
MAHVNAPVGINLIAALPTSDPYALSIIIIV